MNNKGGVSRINLDSSTPEQLKLLRQTEEPDNVQQANRDTVTAKIAEQVKASFMLSGANNGKYQELKNHLENKYAVKQEDG